MNPSDHATPAAVQPAATPSGIAAPAGAADLSSRVRDAVRADAALGALAPRLRDLRIEADGEAVLVHTGDDALQRRCAQEPPAGLRALVAAQLDAPRAVLFPPPACPPAEAFAPPEPAAWPAGATLATFVPTQNTRLAFRAVADSVPATTPRYTPVVVVGGVCLGKTHLLRGFAGDVRRHNPRARVGARTAREFLAEFAYYRDHDALDLFALHQADVDYYLLDDLHLLAPHEDAQEALLGVFERLHAKNAQIVFASAADVRALDGFSPRLAARLGWGVVTPLAAFDVAARRELLQWMNARAARTMPEAVVEHLARCDYSNVREIDAVLRRIDEMPGAGGASALDRVRALTGATAPRSAAAFRRTPTLQDIEGYFLAYAKLTTEVMHSACRSRHVAFPRQLAMYCSHKFTHASMEAIGKYYGGRDHSTVKYACEKVGELIANDPRTRQVIETFKAHFGL